MTENEIQEDKIQRSQARRHLKSAYISLYLLPWEDKTPDVRRRMALISNKFRQYS